MIPGEPLLHVQHPITPPGVVHPNPVHVFVRQVLIVAGVIALVLAFVVWFRSVSPDDDWCIDREDTTCTPAD